MRTRSTVFVLGAGASCPFGFPTGNGLRKILASDNEMSSKEVDRRLIKCGFQDKDIREFVEQFRKSGISSIDAFLAYRDEFHEIGVHAIAAALLPFEHELNLYRANGQLGDSDWYFYLWNLMREGVESAEDLKRNRVKFITFNYDRSLEQYLLNAIHATFHLDIPTAGNALAAIPIHHVYGSLGDFESENGYSYGQFDGDRIRSAATTLRTIPKQRQDDETALSWLRESDQILCLGFGFDRQNCQRIGLDKLVAERKNANPLGWTIMGTARGMTQAEQGRVTADLGSGHHDVRLRGDADCLQFLRDLVHIFD